MFSYLKGSSPSTSPPTSPTQSPTRAPAPCTTSTVAPTQTSQIHHRAGAPRLSRQQSSQDSPVMVITLASGSSSQTKPVTVNSSTSPLSSPTKDSHIQFIRLNMQQQSHPHHHRNIQLTHHLNIVCRGHKYQKELVWL